MSSRGGDRPRQHVRRHRLLQEGQGRGHQAHPRASRPTSPGPRAATDRTEKVANHLILLAKNEEGYANLRYLSSHGLPRRLLLPPAHRQAGAQGALRRGSSALTACLGGEVTSALLPRRHGPRPRARRASTRTSSSPGTSSSRSSPTACPSRRRPTTNLKQLSRDMDIPLVATADAHYIKREDAARARAPDVHRLRQDARRQQADAALHRQALRHQPRGDAGVLHGRAEAVAQHHAHRRACATSS